MSIQKEFALYVPIKGESVKSVGNVVQNDTGGNKIIIRLTDGKNPIDLTGYTNITFSVLKPDGTYVVDSLGDRIAVVDALQGAISVVLHDNAINMAGSCMATIEVFSGTTRVTSARLSFVVTADLTAGADPSSESSYPVLLNLMVDVSALEASVEAAEAIRVTAETGRVNAENTRVSNEASRASGEEGRVLAENSRVSAEGLRNTAESGRVSAENLRESAEEARAFIGAYDHLTAYVVGNTVTYEGSSYRNISPCTGVLPTDTSKWIQTSAKGDPGPQGEQGVQGNPGPAGETGETGRSIVSIIRTSGTGSPGTFDTFTITYSDSATSTFQVYNGADGEGAGDMLRAVYDPNNKNVDAFDMDNMVESTIKKILTATEREKLAGIEPGANNYTHPANHPPSIITQDASNRFVTDTEKSIWNAKSNKNLLHNWDFRNPVNQREQSSYSGVGYTIDRWTHSQSRTLSVSNGYIQIGAEGYDELKQFIVNPTKYSGLTVVASLDAEIASGASDFSIYADGVLVGRNQTFDSTRSIKSFTVTLPIISTSLEIRIITAGGLFKLYRVKLELGPVSTLANDPPADYGEQLVLCQRYFKSLKGIFRMAYYNPNIISFANAEFKGMRLTAPSLVNLGTESTDWNVYGLNGSYVTGFTLSVSNGYILANKTAHSLGDAYLRIHNDKIFLSADL